ncbi:hypothetical protein BASA50_010394 [Batrachochytrium salamandrivorans]|uniref:non-specific serine/threonine protein kinase n=1 Tax=Batrachochytrium salamandrivorans TaxID=1357716 RepID=A0ABQ8EZT6_9FUNG|nr:hypothetical protein BASA50_010394 [Batrachochytrium salamandrivorans]
MWTGVLSHFVTPHYAGQTTQGNTDDGDGGVDQAPDSNPNPKKDTSLPQRVHSLKLTEALQKSNTPDQSDVSLSADPQPKKVCIGGGWIREVSKSCPQQQSSLEPQSSTSYDSPQSDEMPLPACVSVLEVKSYCQGQKADQYNAFIASEIKYFESEYSRKEELGQGAFGVVYRATRKSDGKKVAYKSIPKRNIRNYALESIPPLRCQLPSPLAPSDEPSVAQCMSPRPPNLFVPYESVLQMYLSRPGHENPYVLMALDYIILENEYILVMEYCDEKWATLAKYVEKKGPLDIRDVRDIVREVVDAMIYLKQRGIVHNDIHAHPFAHLVVECEQITGHRIQSGLVPAIQKSRLRLLGRALDPGVENVYTWLRGGVLNGEADLDQRWLDGTVEHESMGTRHDNRVLGQHGLADFLHVAYRAVSIHIVANTTRDRLVEVG